MTGVLADIGDALKTDVVFRLGPVPVTETVVVTWGIMAAMVILSGIVTSRLTLRPGRLQNFLELLVEWIEGLVHDVIRDNPSPYIPLIATLFLYILCANLAPTFVPLIKSPTADIATTAALAIFVFGSVPFFGVRSRGILGYLKTYVEPVFIMLPFNVIGEFSRTLALAVRLFGNVMSGQLIFAVILALAPIFLAPVLAVPLQLLGLLTGTIQAYVFAVLAIVFIGGAVESRRRRMEGKEDNPEG
ncbi:MAG: F0F1 ATP synthase subunit A [Planctomycetota bacterium]|jgi:F-type H+-transporting ATPase subunit a